MWNKIYNMTRRLKLYFEDRMNKLNCILILPTYWFI